jgi:hypothetical protein
VKVELEGINNSSALTTKKAVRVCLMLVDSKFNLISGKVKLKEGEDKVLKKVEEAIDNKTNSTQLPQLALLKQLDLGIEAVSNLNLAETNNKYHNPSKSLKMTIVK